MHPKKDADLPSSQPIPRFWLSGHSCSGDLIRVPGDDHLFFIPMKSPLPKGLNDMFPARKQWGVKEALQTAQRITEKNSIKSCAYFNIELFSKADPVPDDEWRENLVTHAYVGIPRTFTNDYLDEFCRTVDRYKATNCNSVIMVTCGNGHDRCGVAICYYLMKKCEMRLAKAYDIFKAARRPGIYSRQAVDFLNLIKRDKDAKIREAEYLDEFELKKDDRLSEAPVKVEFQPSFAHFNCEKIENRELIIMINELLNKYANKGFVHSNQDSPHSIVNFWDNNSLDLVKKHAFRCTFSPDGAKVFVIALQNDTLIINYGWNQFWTVKAKINCSIPFIATAYAVETRKKLVIYLSDLLYYNRESQDGVDLDERITIIYFDILPGITEIKQDLVFKYRPLGRITDVHKLYSLKENASKDYNFEMAGISFLQRKQPPGQELYFPLKLHVHLKFILNSNNIAILYARSDDGSKLVPFKYFSFKSSSHLSALDQKVIKFQISNEDDWKPIAYCKNEFPDYISFAKSLQQSIPLLKDVDKILNSIEEVVKAQTKKQSTSKKKDGKKSSNK